MNINHVNEWLRNYPPAVFAPGTLVLRDVDAAICGVCPGPWEKIEDADLYIITGVSVAGALPQYEINGVQGFTHTELHFWALPTVPTRRSAQLINEKSVETAGFEDLADRKDADNEVLLTRMEKVRDAFNKLKRYYPKIDKQEMDREIRKGGGYLLWSEAGAAIYAATSLTES